MIAPLWWNDVPAILKGFTDKVMKMGFAYEVTKTGVKGRLTHVQKAIITFKRRRFNGTKQGI